jgi:hypothetical protein
VPVSLRICLVSLAVAVYAPVGLGAQTARSLDSLLAPHQAAMKALAGLDGVWRGQGRTFSASGEQTTFIQTIRVGSFGEGALKLLEGRSYGADGRAYGYNVEVISYAPKTETYALRLYAQGILGDVPIKPLNGGFTLEYPEGAATVRFTIAVTSDTWHEIAERRSPGAEPFRFLELNLHRLGNADWPAAVPARSQ